MPPAVQRQQALLRLGEACGVPPACAPCGFCAAARCRRSSALALAGVQAWVHEGEGVRRACAAGHAGVNALSGCPSLPTISAIPPSCCSALVPPPLHPARHPQLPQPRARRPPQPQPQPAAAAPPWAGAPAPAAAAPPPTAASSGTGAPTSGRLASTKEASSASWGTSPPRTRRHARTTSKQVRHCSTSAGRGSWGGRTRCRGTSVPLRRSLGLPLPPCLARLL